MPHLPQSRIALVLLCTLPLGAVAEGLGLQLSHDLATITPDPAQPTPLFMAADRIEGRHDQATEAFGKVELRKQNQLFYADWMRYDMPTETVSAKDQVRMEQPLEIVEGTSLEYGLKSAFGVMTQPRYQLMAKPQDRKPKLGLSNTFLNPISNAGTALASPTTAHTTQESSSYEISQAPIAAGPAVRFAEIDGRGEAERLLFQGPGRYHLETANYTTCSPQHPAWILHAKTLDIDRNRDEGIARNASVYFYDVPIFYTPYLSFPLHQERKSGFLAPHYRTSNTTGFEFSVPYYWNIAPNMDATITPREMTKRGLQLGGEFRYLGQQWNGQTRAELLAGDLMTNKDRWAINSKHQQALSNNWIANFNFSRVSDSKYFTDLSPLLAFTSQSTLASDITLMHGGTWGDGMAYNFSALTQHWQTLQTDPLSPITPPYNRLPQLTLTSQRTATLIGDFDMISSAVAFDHPTLVNARRFMVNPSLSMPLQNAYSYITPKVGLHYTSYNIGANNTSQLGDATRSVPLISLDSGLNFERTTSIGTFPLVNTLEPKIYYLYVPYHDQSHLPNFDSALLDINFATIFADNQFSGHDRVNNANQLTYGATSRYIDANSGVELFRYALAQRYYFNSQLVTLPGVTTSSTNNKSDLLALARGNIAKNWVAETGWQYNTDLQRTERFNMTTRYQPQAGKVVNVTYRENSDNLRQAELSSQWQINAEWGFVGRLSRSLIDHRNLETLGGLEYRDPCWSLRLVAHRFATTSTTANTSLFLQFELSGLSRSSAPLDVLRRNITGYKQLDPRAPNPVEYNMPGIF